MFLSCLSEVCCPSIAQNTENTCISKQNDALLKWFSLSAVNHIVYKNEIYSSMKIHYN